MLETLTEPVVVVMGGLPVTLLEIELGEELELELTQPGRTRRALMMSFCSWTLGPRSLFRWQVLCENE